MERELLFSQKYDIQGSDIFFHLYREEQEGKVTVTLTYQFPETEEVTCKRIFFPVAAEAYQSPYLSWYNLICCSNNYGPIPVLEYMNTAVQNGKKIAATVYPPTVEAYMQTLAECDADQYYCVPYHPMEYQYMLYVSKKGTLADHFDYEQIKAVYDACGVTLDWTKIQDYFTKELSFFANEELCAIQLHNGATPEDLMITGLLFGYPVESTVALILRTIDMCE